LPRFQEVALEQHQERAELNEQNNQPEDFEAMLRKFLSGAPLDPEQLARAANLPLDPKLLQDLLSQITQAIVPGGSEEGVNWDLAQSQARTMAAKNSKPVAESVGRSISQAVVTGTLWLDEVTDIGQLSIEPKLLSRELWVQDSIGLFRDLAKPVAERMAVALTENFQQNLPEEFSGFMQQASGIMKSAGAVMFAMQLGAALGRVSEEVLSGGDIGLPIFAEPRAAFVAQNLAEYVIELDEEADQVYLYLAIRELAHARLFKFSKWLRDYIVNLITSYASEITIDNSRIMELSENFDPADIENIQKALETGALISPRTESQSQALDRIETTLALIEGWVDCITQRATLRLPRSQAIAEAVRRRRATGGPAESTFLTLIGLELRPRKLREAANMWQAVTDAVGIEARDSIWSHPDLLPTDEDIANPQLLIERVMKSGPDDEMDRALRDLLG
jgi:putative hydrolase